MDLELIYQVNRLIYLSLAHCGGNKRIVSHNNKEMQELMQRFQAEESFRKLVDKSLAAMELRLLAFEEGGLRLSASSSNSLFASTITDYGKILARSDLKAADILCIHCAIATAFFPMESDLDAPVEDLGVILVDDIVEILRRFALEEDTLSEDDDLFHPNVRTAAKRIRELPEENPDIQRSGGGHSWLELINRVIEHMVDTGYLLSFKENGEIEYRPTPSYQTALREGLVYTFHAFREIVAGYQKKSDANGSSPNLLVE